MTTDGTLPSGSGAARVTRTGIALVHEGEIVLPATGSEADAERVLEDARSSVTYYFPVEIEVLDLVQPVDVEAVISETLVRLAQGLGNL
jgi:hypothetical protein